MGNIAKSILSNFVAAIDSGSPESFESALLGFKKLGEVKSNAKVEIGFVVKTIKKQKIERVAFATRPKSGAGGQP